MNNRICRLYGQGDLRVETMPDQAPGEGEVVVRIGAGGICGSDLHYYKDGGFGPIRVKEPIILGHEAAGTVERLGSGVAHLEVGTRVAVNPSMPCGHCQYCLKGQFQHCLNMRFFGSALRFPHQQGLFRDRVVVPAIQCVPIADHVSLAEAACAEPLAVCLHACNRAPDLHGKKVLVTGAGPIGALIVGLAAEAGASEIVVTDLEDAALAVSARMGATTCINVRTAAEALEPYNADKGQFDVTFECSAAAPAIRSAVNATKPLGTIVQVGVAGDLPVPVNLLVGKELNFIGSHRFHAEYREAVDLLNQRKLDLKPIITDSYPVEDAIAAFAEAGDRTRAVKVQLIFAEA